MDEMYENEFRKREMAKTTERLKVLEKLEKYREERMKKEIDMYEEERRKQ
jgi:hypothetical protein